MNRLKSTVLVVCAAVIATASVFIYAPLSNAQSASLSIMPRKNYTIEPGKSVNDTLSIRNLDSENPLHLSLRVVDFTFNDDTGAPKLMLDENEPETTWSLKRYLSIPKNVTIEPNTSQTVDMSVAIPEGHGAGSLYSAIVYSSSSSEGGNVGLSASGVTLVFAQIPGQVNEKLTLEKLGAYDEKKAASGDGYMYFAGEKPEKIAYTLKNDGNVTESPVGSITLRHLFGKETVIQDVNPNGSLALIGQTRTFTSCIKKQNQEVNFNGTRSEATSCAEPDLWPGYYSVELSAFYGQNGNRTQDLVGTASFWYLPWWFVFAVLAALAFVGYHIWKIVRFIRRKRSGAQLKKRTPRRK